MRWGIRLTDQAAKDMRRLDPQVAARMADALRELARDREANDDQARPGAAKALRGRDGEARLRVGKWRIVFELEHLAADPDAGRDDPEGLIVVLQVEGRDQVYKRK